VNDYQYQKYRRDNPPAHAHVKRKNKEAVVAIGQPMTIMDNQGFSEAEIDEILDIMKQRGGTFIYAHWDKYHRER